MAEERIALSAQERQVVAQVLIARLTGHAP
jgi:hypothetical protein